MFNTPILFLIFNRPDHTRLVFDQIRSIKPKYLYIAADGPRKMNQEDREKCALVRQIVTQQIDWPCEVKTLFRSENVGCGAGPAEAISWFFENVEEGIILEDDCLPSASFFNFCSELLAYYRNEPRIMHISGNNFQNEIQRGNASYYFSAYNHNWGWATWRRSWSKFEYTITQWDRPTLLKNLKFYGFNKRAWNYWLNIFENVKSETPKDIWDYQWAYAIWRNQGLSILPNKNLVKNIGFGPDATHTKTQPHQLDKIQLGKIDRIEHPTSIELNKEADLYTFNNHFLIRESLQRLFKNKLLLNPVVRWFYEKVKH